MARKVSKAKRQIRGQSGKRPASKQAVHKPRTATVARKPAPKPTPAAPRKPSTADGSRPVSPSPRRSPMPARGVRPSAPSPMLLGTPRMDLPPPTAGRTGTRTIPVAQPTEGKKVRALTKRDQLAFRQVLLSERQRLVRELERMGERLQQVDEIGVVEASSEDDYADVATETFEREKGFALESSVQGMLRMVEDALRKIDVGKYGICERCGNPIDVERLRALPFASLCIRCKTEEEREKNQLNGRG